MILVKVFLTLLIIVSILYFVFAIFSILSERKQRIKNSEIYIDLLSVYFLVIIYLFPISIVVTFFYLIFEFLESLIK